MPCFECSKCGCIENTATSNYWSRDEAPPFCSECDPKIGKWHQRFEKKSARGFLLGSDGFLYHKDEEAKRQMDWRKKHQGFEIIRIL